MTAVTPFFDGRDAGHCALIAFALSYARRYDHADAVLEASIELRGVRAPRLADAWVFFRAAKQLRVFADCAVANEAHALGVRIATYVTGLRVIDVSRGDVGATSAFAVAHHGPVVRPMGAG